MPTNPTIRPATPADLPRIAEIQSASPEAAHWNPAEYLNEICIVAEAGEIVVAFLVTKITAPGETEILNMAVDPAYRRRGIGRLLLDFSLQGEMFLEVRASNIQAQHLYQNSGFREVGRRPGYYTNPEEDAIVMRFFS